MATSSFYNSSGSTPAVQNSIQTAVTQAAGSATQAATSATQASTSATNAQNSLNSFQQYYLGAYTSAPSTSQLGAMYFDTGTSQLYIWSGSSWDVTASANNLQNTDGLTEGSSNLYFTDERVDDRVNALLTAGSNVTLTYDDAANTLTIASTATGGSGSSTFLGLTDTPTNFTGQAYRYLMVNSTEDAVTTVTPSTDDVSEGSSNLYYTDERVDDRVSNLLTAGSNITLTYNDTANTLTIASTASGGGATTLSGLNDVSNATPANGQVLTYDTSTSLWQPITPSGGSSGSATFTGLTDTPSSFTATKFLRANSGGTALEYATALTPSNLTVTNTAASGGGSVSYIPGANGATLNFTPPDLSSYLTSAALTGSDLDMGGNKVLFGNMYSAEGNLPSATTYHGMFAHVHGTGKGYFAHNGNWIKLIDETSSTTDDLTEGSTNLYYTDARADARIAAADLADLNNVNNTAPSDGQVLTWDNANSYWTPASASGGGGGIALTDLSASNATASGGGSLAYNSTTGVFTLTPPDLSGYATTASLASYATTASLATVATSGAYSDLTGTPNLSGYLTGITGESLYSLSNVYTSSSPTDGQVLTWDNANSYWKPTTVSSGTSIAYLASTSTSAATTNSKPKSLALGSGATVGTNVTDNGIAIGHNATLDMGYSIMIGNDQNAQYQSTIIAAHESSLSSGSGQVSTIVGDNYKVTGNSRSGVTLLGAATAGTNYSTALGYMADAQHSYSVALGFDATTTQSNQLMLGDVNSTDGFTSIRVGNSSYVPSNAMDLTTKSYVDGLAPTAFSGTVQSSTTAINLFNLGAHANYDGGEIVIIADTGSAKQIAKIIFTHQSGAPVFTTYAQITTGSTTQFATFSVVQNSTNLNLAVQQNTGGNVPITASVTYL